MQQCVEETQATMFFDQRNIAAVFRLLYRSNGDLEPQFGRLAPVVMVVAAAGAAIRTAAGAAI
jgi:hypothetical protein